jgi:ABC-2 type transport system ATP-binding protein
MLRIESVSKRFRSGNFGVRDRSLSVKTGVLGLLGPNGGGKTTLMQMIATVTKPTAGRIFFRDTDVVARPDELRHRLGYLPPATPAVIAAYAALPFLFLTVAQLAHRRDLRRSW